MANVIATREWITREAVEAMYQPRELPAIGDALRVHRYAYDMTRDAWILQPQPIPVAVVAALGAAAVVASPRKISRRSLFGLTLFGRKG